jgi:hypothetical protein
MEFEVDKGEERMEDAEKQIEEKERELDTLGKLIGEQMEEINILRDNNQSMVCQISENVMMENKIPVGKKS